MKLPVNYVQCDVTHVRSAFCHYTFEQALHVQDCHVYTQTVHVRESMGMSGL